ncbi:C-type lectin domain family 4 member E-like isoform X1 [Gambusia affinis]|uniref:C-type lectin domain family 4 member E-like isoform X1 n=1 Tax=Gambusia affinis TaxID=33528 RepID=UPI001CDC0653|nr:C-type lectin domain family 4 member E-like isoform X1 [Gambusia affinis]XP_043993649.1 C-type lectin domain family 4 member E-like isoform X1 [Gambusia affinis]XP_043993650.1 C-type lectin domain family 4 member E-like isoform X1 [Gambusia affinis]
MRFTKSVPRVNAALVDDNIYDDVMVSKQQDNVSSVADDVYDDVMVSKQDKVSSLADNNSAEDQLSKQKANLQQPGWDRKSKVSPEHAVLLVLITLLVVTVFALSITVFYLMKNERCQTLKEDLESLKMMALDETCPKCEAGWERYRESCYFFSTNKSSWTDSRRSCTDLGSDLVKIDSREEQMFLEIRLKETIENNETFWIGLTDSKTEGSWLWPDSSPLNTSLSFWAPGQPDALGGAEVDCVCMMKTENPDEVRWFDGRCDDDLRSVCEKDSKIQLRFCV